MAPNFSGFCTLSITVFVDKQKITTTVSDISIDIPTKKVLSLEYNNGGYQVTKAQLLAEVLQIVPQNMATISFASNYDKDVIAFTPPKDYATKGLNFEVVLQDDTGKQIKTQVNLPSIKPFAIIPAMPLIKKNPEKPGRI